MFSMASSTNMGLTMVLVAFWVTVVLTAFRVRPSVTFWRSPSSSSKGNLSQQPHTSRVHNFVVLADPQLGMLHGSDPNPDDWEDELVIFKALIKAAKAHNPAFIFVAGDMQNAWPNKFSDDDKTNAAMLKLGEKQRADVKTALQEAEGVTLQFTAGNHDVGNVIDSNTAAMYEKEWGHLCNSFWQDGILYVQFTAQFYFNHSLDGGFLSNKMDAMKKEQTARLSKEFQTAASAKGLVLLTHIPPFMETDDEDAGWANWNKTDRKHILDLLAEQLADKNVPITWVCGHFHTNVKNIDYTYTHSTYRQKSVGFQIIVVSSCGTTIWWDNCEGTMSPADAGKVASIPIGQAFFRDVCLAGIKGTDTPKEKACEEGIPRLVQATPSRSGLGLFTVSDAGVTAEWKTLN